MLNSRGPFLHAWGKTCSPGNAVNSWLGSHDKIFFAFAGDMGAVGPPGRQGPRGQKGEKGEKGMCHFQVRLMLYIV